MSGDELFDGWLDLSPAESLRTPPQPTFEPRNGGPSGAGRITYTPQQLKDAALFLTMRTYMAGDRVSQSAALVAHAYLQEIGVLPRD